MRRKPLAGKGIVVTRPAHQARSLTRLISAAGGKPLPFPVIEIRDIEDKAPLLALIDRLDEFNMAIFVSPNAAEKGMALVKARRAWPAKLKAAAVGSGGLKTLERHGITDVIAPVGRFDSEALLELPQLAAVSGWRVVVFRGDGGRELLGDTLRERGAAVDYVECYRRARPNADVEPLLKRWGRGEVDAVTVSSSEGLRNLYDMLGKLGQAWLKRTPLFAPHARIAANARALGCERVIETAPADEGLREGLVAFLGQ
jgi:uroporphyrinogen-III synthase